MSDDKDQVLDQIESDARKAVKEYPSALSLMYEAGAYNQDPIAWNRCLDAVIRTVRVNSNCFSWVDGEILEMIELLEKLRK